MLTSKGFGKVSPLKFLLTLKFELTFVSSQDIVKLGNCYTGKRVRSSLSRNALVSSESNFIIVSPLNEVKLSN